MAAQTPNTPIVDYPHQSVVLDTLVVERTSSKLGTSAPREPGAPYRKQGHSAKELSAFSGMLFLGQKASDDDEWQNVFYGTNPQCQDIYNFAISYVAESNLHPAFARSYLVKRDDYFTTRPAKGTAFTGVFIVQVTAGGTGYTAVPTVVFTGGAGTGATALAILDNNGAVSKVTLKTEGAGFTSAPAISFTGGGGTGAAATAYIQAAGCILVEEKTGDAPMPYGSLYITAMRLYKTLPGPILPGQQYDDVYNFAEQFTEQDTLAGVGLGDPLKKITPVSSVEQKVLTTVIPTAALNAFVRQFPATTNLRLPDILVGLSVVWENATGDGSYSETAEGAAVGSSVHLSFSVPGSGQGSATVMPSLVPIILSTWDSDSPVMDYFFFLPHPITLAQVQAKLLAIIGGPVVAWPAFRPVSHTFTLKGQKVSINAKVNASFAVSISGDDASYSGSSGSGLDRDKASMVRTVTLPAMLHGAISISGDTEDDATVNVGADAATPSGTNFPGDAAIIAGSLTAYGSVTPTTLAATSPAGFPASGLGLKELQCQNFRWGYCSVRARVFDFAFLA